MTLDQNVVMAWSTVVAQAPTIAEVFKRRHAATGKLCMLATLRRDGFPRISPMEPRFFEGELWLVGMPNTTKFNDLARDPRFSLHTATVDTNVTDGDAKVWGRAVHVGDAALHERFAQDLFDDIGLDLRGERFDQFLRADIEGGSSVRYEGGHLDIFSWRLGGAERVTRKH